MSQGWTSRLVQLLQQEDVIDQDENWIAGDTQLVYLGNLFGYGPENLEGLFLLKKLADQADEAGGHVHFLLGSTDFVNLRGVLSTMPSSVYESLATADSQARLDDRLGRWLEELWAYNGQYDEERRLKLRNNYEKFYRRNHKPGAMEFLDYFAPGTEIGDWIRKSNTIIRIDDVIYASGGLHPFYAKIPFERINTYYRNEFNKDSVFVPVMADRKAGPAIWRGLSFPSKGDPSLEDINDILADLGARMMVVGHSPARFGQCMLKGRVLHVDSNMLTERDSAAYNAVVIDGENFDIDNSGRVRHLHLPKMPTRTEPAPTPQK